MLHKILLTLLLTASLFTAAAHADTTRWTALADSASAAMDAERWPLAEELLTEALRADPANPSNPMLFSNLGVARMQNGRNAQAIECFDIALLKAPGSPVVLAHRAKAHLLAGDHASALADMTRVLEIDSTRTDIRRLRALTLLRDGDPSRALADLERILPTTTDASIHAAAAEAATLTGDTERAITLWISAMTTAEEPPIYVQGIHALLASDHIQDAESFINQGVKLFPTEGMLYLYAARLHHLRYQAEEEKINKKIALQYGVDPQTVDRYLSQPRPEPATGTPLK